MLIFCLCRQPTYFICTDYCIDGFVEDLFPKQMGSVSDQTVGIFKKRRSLVLAPEPKKNHHMEKVQPDSSGPACSNGFLHRECVEKEPEFVCFHASQWNNAGLPTHYNRIPLKFNLTSQSLRLMLIPQHHGLCFICHTVFYNHLRLDLDPYPVAVNNPYGSCC